MSVYRIPPSSISKISRKSFLWTISYLICVVAIVLGYFYLNDSSSAGPNIWVALIAIVVLALTVGVSLGRKWGNKILTSFTITVNDSTITRERADTPTITIRANEIKSK